MVHTIVQKLGYTEDEIRRYVLTDKNSFVGVLYQKLYDDQNEKRMLMEKQNQMIQRQLAAQNMSSNTASDTSISAKLPI